MRTTRLIPIALAIAALAAAPAQAENRKGKKPAGRPQAPQQRIMPHSDLGNPAYRAGDPDVVYSNRNPFRVLGKSSDPRIRSRMREDDDIGFGPP